MTPAKWVRVWNERMPRVPLTLVPVAAADAVATLRSREADAGLLRLPVDGTDLSAIPLYSETTVVVVPKDHVITAAEEVRPEDLADELVLHPLDDTLDWEHPPGRPALERPATTADAIELVAAGVGVLVLPQSLARLHHRKDLTYRPLADVPQSRVALSWPQDATTDLVEEFIGIVRGRTVNSSRGRAATPAKAAKDAESTKSAKAAKAAKSARKAPRAGTGSTGAGKGAGRSGGGTRSGKSGQGVGAKRRKRA